MILVYGHLHYAAVCVECKTPARKTVAHTLVDSAPFQVDVEPACECAAGFTIELRTPRVERARR